MTPSLADLAASTPLLAEVDLVKLLSNSKGVVLVVVITQLTLIPLTLFVIVYKLIHVSQAASQSVNFLGRFWESKRLDELFKVAERLRASPLAQMYKAGYVELSKVKKRSAEAAAQGSMREKMDDSENIERALNRARVSEMTKLENLLPFLATVGAASPFIGLFGTVWGIMEAFLNIAASGSAELSEIAQPIAEALVTTALALASAVPAVVAFNYFNRRLKVLQAEAATFASDYINIIRRHFF